MPRFHYGCVRVRVCVYVNICTYIHIHVCVCVHAFACVYTMTPRTEYMYTHTHTHRWILCLFCGLLWTTMGGAVDFGPEDANWKTAVETGMRVRIGLLFFIFNLRSLLTLVRFSASPGTTVSLRPGVYNACNVAVPAGVTNLD